MEIQVTFKFSDMNEKQVDSLTRCFRKLAMGHVIDDEDIEGGKEEESLTQLPFKPYADEMEEEELIHQDPIPMNEGMEDVFDLEN